MKKTQTNAAGLYLGGGSYVSPATQVVDLEIEGALCDVASVQDDGFEEWDEEDLW